MDEIEKMRSCQLYNFHDPKVVDSIKHAARLCAKLSSMTPYDEGYRELLEQLIPGIPSSSFINPPFHCDHGHGIKIGEEVFINFNCTILDSAVVKIGARTKIGPNCQFVTPNHPMDYEERRKPQETGFPITIGEDCWIGAGVTICPGVTIGGRTVIAAGSVVTKDIPSDVLAVGVPTVVKKRLNV